MFSSFFELPYTRHYALRRVRVPGCVIEGAAASMRADGLVDVDLVIEDGNIAGIEAPNSTPSELGPDLGCSIVWPGFVDVHTHLDKGHIWPRAANPNGTTSGAIAAVASDRSANWASEDVRRRMEFGLA